MKRMIINEKGMSVLAASLTVAALTLLLVGILPQLDLNQKSGDFTAVDDEFSRVNASIRLIVEQEDACTSALAGQNYNNEIRIYSPFSSPQSVLVEADMVLAGFTVNHVTLTGVRTLDAAERLKLGYIQVTGQRAGTVSGGIGKLSERTLVRFITDNTDTSIERCETADSVYESPLVAEASFCQDNVATPGAIIGTNGNDKLEGTPGDDILYGVDGNDLIIGHGGNDIICGGAGQDYIVGESLAMGIVPGGQMRVDGGADDDFIGGSSGNDEIYGGSGNDTIMGQDGNDLIYGADGADRIWGGNGSDTIHAGTGDDAVYGGNQADIINGDEGNDVLDGGDQGDTINGGPGFNVINGGNQSDVCTRGSAKTQISSCETVN